MRRWLGGCRHWGRTEGDDDAQRVRWPRRLDARGDLDRHAKPAGGFLVALWLVAAAYLALHGQPATGRDEGGAFALSAVLALLMVGLTAPAPAPPWRQPPHPSRTRLWAQNAGGRPARSAGWRTAVITRVGPRERVIARSSRRPRKGWCR